MSIFQLDFEGKTKLERTIDRLKVWEPPEGYYMAFSGGKDSTALKGVADMAGVKYEAYYNVSSVDAPEVLNYIKEYHPDVIWQKTYWPDGTPITMWNLIPHKKRPPTRQVRYCCEYLKEGQGSNRFVITGVRWAESPSRANRGGIETSDKPWSKQWGQAWRENLDPDNPSQEMIHICHQKAQKILNPLIDWTDDEVWEFIKAYNLPYCSLYDEGFKRVGCIGCPMAGEEKQKIEFKRWPKYYQNYLKAFERMIKAREERGLEARWKTAQQVMDWWLFQEDKGEPTLLNDMEVENE